MVKKIKIREKRDREENTQREKEKNSGGSDRNHFKTQKLQDLKK